MTARPRITATDRERGERIKALRIGRRESQAAFGEHFGVEQATVSRWEEGYPVRRAHWEPLAALAGTSPAEFFFGRQVEIPIISWVAASRMADMGEVSHPADAPTVLASGLPPGDWFALRVEGDSMDRIAPPGSVIFVDRHDKSLVSKMYYVFEGPEGATFKRYMDRPKRLEPYSTNPVHETQFPQRDLRIIGRVRRVVTDV